MTNNNKSMSKRVLSLVMMALAVSSATCSEVWKPSTLVGQKSYADNVGHTTAISANAARAFASPHYDGSVSKSGSFVQAGHESTGYTDAVSHAETNDKYDDEHTQADSSSSAQMSVYHHVPSSDTSTNFFSVAAGKRPFAESSGKDIVLNSPYSAGSLAKAAAGAAFTDASLFENGIGLAFSNIFNKNFPEYVLLGVEAENVGRRNRKLLSEDEDWKPKWYDHHAFARTHGGSNGTAHGAEATALGGGFGDSLDTPFGQASIADTLDFAKSGPIHGMAMAESKSFTESSLTDALSKGFAFMQTDWYEPKGAASAEVHASANGDWYEFSDGKDISIVTPTWAGSHGRGESASSVSEPGLWGTLGTVAHRAHRFPSLTIPEIVHP